MPLLQGAGQLAADGGVERLQARLHERQPRVDPRVDGHRVRQRVPALHLQGERKGPEFTQPVGQADDALLAEQVCGGPQSPLHSPKTGLFNHQYTYTICIQSRKRYSSKSLKKPSK